MLRRERRRGRGARLPRAVSFAAGDRIFVPVEQIARITRYSGGERPQLSKLGGTEWLRTKQRVRKAVADLAEELLRAVRRARRRAGPRLRRPTRRGRGDGGVVPVRGDARPAPRRRSRSRPTWSAAGRWTGWSSATWATARPRSRCGPRSRRSRTASRSRSSCRPPCSRPSTTRRSRQRFAAFPVRVGLLSRFVAREGAGGGHSTGWRTASWTSSSGRTGCCRKDVRFRDLGLVVVDEEQRFGVAAKERLKQLRREVDVLTLSATPIPRTLNLALAGIRDMSVIETPPEDRLPIQTRVAEASAGLVRDAILRELDRGGQVFYVHNRVETIEAQAEQLRAAAARTLGSWSGTARWPRAHLEKVMLAFADGPGRRPRVHHDHRVRPRHPERQHDHHRPCRHARPGPALPAARTRGPVARAGPTRTCSTGAASG